MSCFRSFTTPQIKLIHKGKVRDSYSLNSNERMIAVTDRVSAFDMVLNTPIPKKGAVLNGIANFWFNKTSSIIENHLIKEIDPNISIVKEVTPVKIEMIVRGYLTGSMWRYYQQGKRNFSGVSVGEGFTKNMKFDKPILTPTTKEDSDREITKEEIIATGLASKELYESIAEVALKLYDFGAKYLHKKGIILVDTKYEFGLLNNKLILIDEIHTPDSSRFWRVSDYQSNPETAEQIDKEFLRQWLIENKTDGQYRKDLPQVIVDETSKRYLEIYELITGHPLQVNAEEEVNARIYRNLVRHSIIKEGFVTLIMGSEGDLPHAEKIKSFLEPYDIFTQMRIVSAHKNGEDIIPIADELNNSIEPGAVIAIAGRSNGLGGALSANLNIPVINCPPFKDSSDIMLNINSSLMMPSAAPAMTVIHPDNAAAAALRCLNIPTIRLQLSSAIREVKSGLRESDNKFRKL